MASHAVIDLAAMELNRHVKPGHSFLEYFKSAVANVLNICRLIAALERENAALKLSVDQPAVLTAPRVLPEKTSPRQSTDTASATFYGAHPEASRILRPQSAAESFPRAREPHGASQVRFQRSSIGSSGMNVRAFMPDGRAATQLMDHDTAKCHEPVRTVLADAFENTRRSFTSRGLLNNESDSHQFERDPRHEICQDALKSRLSVNQFNAQDGGQPVQQDLSMVHYRHASSNVGANTIEKMNLDSERQNLNLANPPSTWQHNNTRASQDTQNLEKDGEIRVKADRQVGHNRGLMPWAAIKGSRYISSCTWIHPYQSLHC